MRTSTEICGRALSKPVLGSFELRDGTGSSMFGAIHKQIEARAALLFRRSAKSRHAGPPPRFRLPVDSLDLASMRLPEENPEEAASAGSA
jgi:hypothetical protein